MAWIGGGAMSGGRFRKMLTIDADGRVLPEGSLELDPGEQPIKLYVWVVQIRDEGEGAAAAGFQDHHGLSRSSMEWVTRNDVVHDGKFKPGTAVGLALAIMEETTTKEQKPHWWTGTIKLE